MRVHSERIDLGTFKRQKCNVCRCEDKFNFHVPDDVWQKIVPAELQNKVVCLPCFDEFAREKNADYSEAIEVLYFAGRQASFKFETVSSSQGV